MTDTTKLVDQARLRASRKCADGYAVPFDVNLDNALADAIERLTRERDEARTRFNDIDLCKTAQAPCNALLDAEARIAELTRERDAEKADAAKWFAEYMALSHKQKGPVPDAALQARIAKLEAALDSLLRATPARF